MIFDLDQETPDLGDGDFDVCITGAGVAGSFVALKLISYGLRVLIVEAGGLAPAASSQEFYRGVTSGIENLPLDTTRVRALGGSSNHWGGWCRAFDPGDFRRIDYQPGGAWPITEADLAPYSGDAVDALLVTRAAGADLDLVGSEGNLRSIRMMFSVPPARIGQTYGPVLMQTPKAVVLVNAAATDAAFDTEAGRMTSLTVRNPARGVSLECRAKAFVLAMGTVENLRNLLIWNRQFGDRVGNQGGLLGRYYLQHLHQELGRFVLMNGAESSPALAPGASRGFFATTGRFTDRSGTGAVRFTTDGLACAAVMDSLRQVATGAACSAVTAGRTLLATAEQRPNPASRITLSDTLDQLGRPLVDLGWQITGDDAATLKEAAIEFGRYLVRANLGRLKLDDRILAGETPLAGWTALDSAAGAAGHQMGGARMGLSAADGVVSRDCLVWGTTNLYVAGAAVFRTSSQATPTFTITQLAHRLGDHVGRLLRRG